MCMVRKAASFEYTPPEVIKDPVRADASTQKANAENRTGKKDIISENIKTSNIGVDDEIASSKKKLLGE